MSGETSSYRPPPPTGTVTVVGPQFTAAHPMDLLMTDKFSFGKDSFVVTDVNGNTVLKVKYKGAFSGTIFLLDNAGNTIVSLRPKTLSLSGIWRVYRGDSSEPKDLLFTAKDSPGLHFKYSLNVFLAHNEAQKVPDFIVKASKSWSSCTIYSGDSDSSTVIAQGHEKNSFKSVMKGKEIIGVSVNPNVDYAFIVTLVVILYEKLKEAIVAGAS